jgi:hypothetical protein
MRPRVVNDVPVFIIAKLTTGGLKHSVAVAIAGMQYGATVLRSICYPVIPVSGAWVGSVNR